MGIRSPQLLPGMIPLIRTPCIIDLSPIPVTKLIPLVQQRRIGSSPTGIVAGYL
jgi:hypothetical protein